MSVFLYVRQQEENKLIITYIEYLISIHLLMLRKVQHYYKLYMINICQHLHDLRLLIMYWLFDYHHLMSTKWKTTTSSSIQIQIYINVVLQLRECYRVNRSVPSHSMHIHQTILHSSLSNIVSLTVKQTYGSSRSGLLLIYIEVTPERVRIKRDEQLND